MAGADQRLYELGVKFDQGQMTKEDYIEQYRELARESSANRLNGWVSPLTTKPFNFDSIYETAAPTPTATPTTTVTKTTTPAPTTNLIPNNNGVMDSMGNLITDGQADVVKKTPWLLLGLGLLALLLID